MCEQVHVSIRGPSREEIDRRNVGGTYAVLESCVIQMIYNSIGLSLERGPMCKECCQNGVREGRQLIVEECAP